MKRLIALSLLFVFLGANTKLHQLLKLPVLIHHFLEHQTQEPNETIADFLVEHYSDTQNHSEPDHHNHDNLPFKTNDCATAHVLIAFENHISFSVPSPNSFKNAGSPIYDGVIYFSVFHSIIWQPPKTS